MAAIQKNDHLKKIVKTNWLSLFANHQKPVVEVGLSGGVDSVVLTHILFSLAEELNIQLQAVYVHHGLSQFADEWANFCAQFCAKLGIRLHIQKVFVDQKSTLGVEAEARKQRYRVYQQSKANIIALAHHQDDQIETVLLQLFRGGGVHALAGMPSSRLLQNKSIWRPLLSVSKKQLVEYANHHDLKHVEDDSNASLMYRRNWVRSEVLPLLRNHVADIDQHIVRSNYLMQQSSQILDEVIEQDLAQVSVDGYFDCLKWDLLTAPRKNLVLLHFVQTEQLGNPSPESLIHFSEQLKVTDPSTQLLWQLPHGQVYAYKKRLYIEKKYSQPIEPLWINHIKPQIFENGTLLWIPHHQGISKKLIDQGVWLCSRASGEKIQLKVGHKKVKTILQEQHFPPFLKKYWPLIFNAQKTECLAIVSVVCRQDEAQETYFPIWVELKSEFKFK
ncbi:tRNA lysidine(34) synthetase TilS [Neisseria sp. Ec49-e6-T10]|uniref:tRNA lysidine(34) synthetase TilS n=1 Tax=Neisseria sp. Ec49-e6-T10 TaxID=3140744 RepID=UPI003EB86FE9